MSLMDEVLELKYNVNRSFEYLNEMADVENHNAGIVHNTLEDLNFVSMLMLVQIVFLIISHYYMALDIEKIQEQLKDKTTDKL
tara:strand:+ start:164 stop:412 length:249 start_codon:yes stop_codon:yes gene_type:complete